MALGITTEEFYLLAGHNGGEIVFPELTEPYRRRGFHVSEAVMVALRHCCTASPVELEPRIASNGDLDRTVAVRYSRVCNDNWAAFTTLIQSFQGVIECRTYRGWHAVAFDTGRIYDPDGREFDYSREACESRGLYTTRLWIVGKTNESV